MPLPENLDDLTPAELRSRLLELLGRVRDLERQLAARDGEIARLKGLKARPDIKPSGMERGTHAPAEPSPGHRRGGGNKTARRAIHEVRVVKATVPPGYTRTAPVAKPKLGALLPVIDAILDADRMAPIKQRHTAKRISERLRDEHGFAGGYTVVKDHVVNSARPLPRQ